MDSLSYIVIVSYYAISIRRIVFGVQVDLSTDSDLKTVVVLELSMKE